MSDPLPSPEALVEEALNGPSRPSICCICQNEPLARALAHFMKLKVEGDPRAAVPLTGFYQDKLKEPFNGPTACTVRLHVAKCMGLTMQGKPRD